MGGNLKGDGWQTGGLLVIDGGNLYPLNNIYHFYKAETSLHVSDGNVLYSFKQDKLTDRPDYHKIMDLFNLQEGDLTPL